MLELCAWGSADDKVQVSEQICRYADVQTRRHVGTTKKPLSVVTLKEAVKIKLAATYSPAGVQYHRRGWA